jgi:anti-sigma regulatory factor (Ser/Thr protein kinase)
VHDQDTVHLVMPASPEFVRLARVTASGLASRLGFSIDELDDLRLAVDELCHTLVGLCTKPGVISLRYTTHQAALEVTGTGHFDPGGPPAVLGELSHQILTALVDSHEVGANADGLPSVWLRKRAAARGGC